MKLLPIDPVNRRWDAHKEFYMGVSKGGATNPHHYGSAAPFIQFETGEVVCTLRDPNPNYRGEYSHLNVAVYKTGDKKCPKFFFRDTGMPVAKAWLETRGQPALLLDHCTTRAVQLRGAEDNDPVDHLPERFVTTVKYTSQSIPKRQPRFTAYFAGEGRDPHGSPIEVVPPLNISLTPDEYAHVKDITAACKAWYAMTDHHDKGKFVSPQVTSEHVLQASTIADLHSTTRVRIAERGIKRKIMYEPYLVF